MRYQQSPNIHKLNMVSIYVIEIVAKLAYNDINNAHTFAHPFRQQESTTIRFPLNQFGLIQTKPIKP